MTTRKTLLAATLIATVGGLAAAPAFAQPGDGANAPVQLADRGDGHGWRGPRGRGDDDHHHGWRGDRGPGFDRGRGRGDDDHGRGFGRGPGGDHGPRFGGPGMRGPGMGGPGMAFLLERFDTDKNGVVTKAEILAVNTDRVGRFDADKDGALSLDEFTALWTETMKLQIVRAFQDRDPDGDAKVTLEEYAAPFDQMATRLDRNNDGTISADELGGPRMRDGMGPRGMGGPAGGPPPAMDGAPAPDAAPDAGNPPPAAQ